ncbi:hypothetical protein GCM10027291_46180 [Telluribacter humicola]
MSGSLLDQYVTHPISDNLAVFSNFVFSVCAIMGLVGGLRIYIRVMNGEEQVSGYAFRWLGAILAVLVIGATLQHIAGSQTPMQGDSHIRSFMNSEP